MFYPNKYNIFIPRIQVCPIEAAYSGNSKPDINILSDVQGGVISEKQEAQPQNKLGNYCKRSMIYLAPLCIKSKASFILVSSIV